MVQPENGWPTSPEAAAADHFPRGRVFNRLWVRLSIYFSAFAVLSALLLVVAARLLVADTVRQSLLPGQLQAPGGIIDTLRDYYHTHGNWDGVDPILYSTPGDTSRWSAALICRIVDASGAPIYAESVKGHPVLPWVRAR
ncbi:MAG: hypothetical protein R2932_28520 [Caldilineaceae bacterium]